MSPRRENVGPVVIARANADARVRVCVRRPNDISSTEDSCSLYEIYNLIILHARDRLRATNCTASRLVGARFARNVKFARSLFCPRDGSARLVTRVRARQVIFLRHRTRVEFRCSSERISPRTLFQGAVARVKRRNYIIHTRSPRARAANYWRRIRSNCILSDLVKPVARTAREALRARLPRRIRG